MKENQISIANYKKLSRHPGASLKNFGLTLLIRVNPILSAAPRQGPAAGTCPSAQGARRRGALGPLHVRACNCLLRSRTPRPYQPLLARLTADVCQQRCETISMLCQILPVGEGRGRGDDGSHDAICVVVFAEMRILRTPARTPARTRLGPGSCRGRRTNGLGHAHRARPAPHEERCRHLDVAGPAVAPARADPRVTSEV